MKKLPDTYRLIYTTPDGQDRPSAPKSRELAMVAFYREVETIAAHPLVGKERIRVLSDAEWRKSEAARAAGMAGAR